MPKNKTNWFLQFRTFFKYFSVYTNIIEDAEWENYLSSKKRKTNCSSVSSKGSCLIYNLYSVLYM